MFKKEAVLKYLGLEALDEGGYIQFRETDEHYIMDIGRSEEIEAIWDESFARMKALEDKFKQKLLDILRSLQQEEKMFSEEENLSLLPSIAATPSKGTPAKGGRNKRPVPQSSSVNKVILHRAKQRLNNVGFSSEAEKAPDHNSTPAKTFTGNSRLQLTPSPYVLRRLNAENDKMKKLIASEDKRKKADEKKQQLLHERTQKLNKEREKRMEIIRKNKLAQEQQVKEAAATKTKKSTNEKGKRYEQRRQMLKKAIETEPRTRAAKARAAAEASTQQATGDSAIGSSSSQTNTGTGKQPEPERNEIAFSPIARESYPKKGINQRLSETFTSEVAPTSANNGGNLTFAVPQGVPPSKSVAASTTTLPVHLLGSPHSSTFQTNKKAQLTTSTAGYESTMSQYEMTPPPKTPVYLTDNYDISKYIDSDDEEAQVVAQEKSSKKRIPPWAMGKPFLNLLHKQFAKSPKELIAQSAQIFPRARLPVPLEEMGMPVKERYATRSSSVNWKTVAEIKKLQ